MNHKILRGAIILAFVAAHIVRADRFDNLWYDGNAEISTYRISEMRYGEPREGVRIMVFVTEPMCLKTLICRGAYIKPDRIDPDMETIKVLKLNDLRKFPTGIYEYSTMTSGFIAVEAKKNIPLMSTMKLSFTAQEWCGMYYERILRKEKGYEGMLHSYFETEGDKTYAFPHRGTQVEDNLWMIVRELTGPVLTAGQSKKMNIITSVWARRKTHEPPATVAVTLSKGKKRRQKTAVGTMQAHPFSWKKPAGTTTVWVEAAYPHRILSWREPDGSTGEIMASRREPYWKQNKNRDLHLRRTLGLENIE